MGPTGSGTPVYLFSQDFDSYTSESTYNGSQFIVVDPNAAGTLLYVSNEIFVSASNSLYLVWDANPGAGAGLYTASGFFSVPANTDCTFDSYLNLSGLTSSGEEAELVLNLNGATVADLGFDISSNATANAYTYNNGASYTIATGLSTGFFHHVVLAWSHATGLSSITLDGESLAQNINGTRSPQPLGAPSTSVGVSFPVGVSAALN
ncbi:MAG: hypothetical protein ACREKE_02965, partial [bacterium]